MASATPPKKRGLSTGAKDGITVGGTALVLLVFLGRFHCFRRRRRRKAEIMAQFQEIATPALPELEEKPPGDARPALPNISEMNPEAQRPAAHVYEMDPGAPRPAAHLYEMDPGAPRPFGQQGDGGVTQG